MPSPFNYKNKDKTKKPKPMATQPLAEVNLGTVKNKKTSEQRYGSASRNNVQQVLRTPQNYAKPNYKPNYPEPANQVKVDYTPPRPLINPNKQYIKPEINKPRLNPIIEAYTPAQFEGAKPLAQSNQRKIYSTFKEQMEQLKNK